MQQFVDAVTVRLVARPDALAAQGLSNDGEEALRQTMKSSASAAKQTKRATDTAVANPGLGAALDRGQ